MQTRQATQFRRLAPILGAAALSAALGAPALAAAEHVVHVGRGGTYFIDDASGTGVTTIVAGDTVQWVWEGTMNHSVSSGVCPTGGGGGYGGYGGGGGACIPSMSWDSGIQASGFTFSHTFENQGSFSYFCMMHQSAMTGKVIVQPLVSTGPCVVDTETLCLNDGRFRLTAEWEKLDGSSGHGNGIKLTEDSGYFWFFDPTNIEVVVKVLNGCGLNPPAYWVFGAGLTNVAVHLVVTDTSNGAVYTRDNAQGSAFQPVQDTRAFPSSCP